MGKLFNVCIVLFVCVFCIYGMLYMSANQHPNDYITIYEGTVVESGCVSTPFKSGHVHDCRINVKWGNDIHEHRVTFSSLAGDTVLYKCKETNRFAYSDKKYETCGITPPDVRLYLSDGGCSTNDVLRLSC